MRRAIYEDDVIKLLDKGWKSGVYPVASNIHALPSAQPDTRSLEQIKWERDIAIQQLKDLGYSLGEKIRTDGDTISRQALMKEFSDFVRASNNSDFARTPTWNDAVSLVGSMPSAQPEQAAKGCRNCKYGKYNDHWKTHFCYNPNECTEWNLWEPSAQPEPCDDVV